MTRSPRDPSDRPLPVRLAFWLYRASASLQLAVVLIAVYALVLAWATFVESWYGTAAAHFGIYRTWWFLLLNVVLGLNVLAAAVIRFPWKRRQTGFLVPSVKVSGRNGAEFDLPFFATLSGEEPVHPPVGGYFAAGPGGTGSSTPALRGHCHERAAQPTVARQTGRAQRPAWFCEPGQRRGARCDWH